ALALHRVSLPRGDALLALVGAVEGEVGTGSGPELADAVDQDPRAAPARAAGGRAVVAARLGGQRDEQDRRLGERDRRLRPGDDVLERGRAGGLAAPGVVADDGRLGRRLGP